MTFVIMDIFQWHHMTYATMDMFSGTIYDLYQFYHN